MLAVAAALTGDAKGLDKALAALTERNKKMRLFLTDLHFECKDQRVPAPSELNDADGYLRDYLRLNEVVADDHLNTGELPALYGLVADLFDDAHADPVALVLALKDHMRKHGMAAMDAAYDAAKLGGAFR
jgi:hypothetical protein